MCGSCILYAKTTTDLVSPLSRPGQRSRWRMRGSGRRARPSGSSTGRASPPPNGSVLDSINHSVNKVYRNAVGVLMRHWWRIILGSAAFWIWLSLGPELCSNAPITQHWEFFWLLQFTNWGHLPGNIFVVNVFKCRHLRVFSCADFVFYSLWESLLLRSQKSLKKTKPRNQAHSGDLTFLKRKE